MTSVPSPDSNRLAVIHEMGCGATDGFNTQVGIAPANQPFSRIKILPFSRFTANMI
jgi:hypothetical protein